MSKHKDIWTDKEWKELMKLQGEALKSRLEGDQDERRTEIKEEKDS